MKIIDDLWVRWVFLRSDIVQRLYNRWYIHPFAALGCGKPAVHRYLLRCQERADRRSAAATLTGAEDAL